MDATIDTMDGPTRRWSTGRPQIGAPQELPPEYTPTTPIPTAPRMSTRPAQVSESDELAAVLGAILESLTKPELTMGQKVAAWFQVPANLLVLAGALYGAASGAISIRDQWRENMSFQETAIQAHEDIGATLASTAATLAELRDEVIAIRAADKGRRRDPE